MLFLMALVCVSFWMFAWWLVYLVTKNGVFIDLAWTLAVGGVSLLYLLNFEGNAIPWMVLMGIWTLRLTFLIVYRIARHGRDPRYDAITQKWEGKQVISSALMHLFQGASILIFTLPLLALSFAVIQGLAWIGWIVSFIGVIGVMIADNQLQRFLAKSEKGQVCQVGLWKFSRHPNYFFEWIFWLGLFLSALTTPLGYLTIISPLAMLGTLLYLTGIPPAEKQALKTKGEKYAKYQKETSSFIPWWPKHVPN